ncbi:GNAT family N-acetyltransferase [Aestuariivirga sp.]|uniref:GNAT family N-acetyltransferase n=1 Tax=Aestuariivirga sp. TaxID=2650926 RepID=UPI00391998CF
MAFLRSPFAADPPPSLRDGHAMIRVPDMVDYEQWSELRRISRDFLTPWEPVWPANDLTRTAYRSRIRQYWRDIEEDLAYPYFIFDSEGEVLVGALTLSNVRRGVAQTATLGYWIGAPFARRGYMTSAVRLILELAFHHLSLHRVEAACLPHNKASVGLLTKCGFSHEGLARGYLKIAGEWRDHLLFARLSD